MKNHITLNSVQTQVTKISKHHRTSHDLFSVNYLLTARKPTMSICYVINRSISGTITHRSIHKVAIKVVRGLCAVRNTTRESALIN